MGNEIPLYSLIPYTENSSLPCSIRAKLNRFKICPEPPGRDDLAPQATRSPGHLQTPAPVGRVDGVRTRGHPCPNLSTLAQDFFSHVTTRPVFEEGPIGSCALFNSFPRAQATSNYLRYSNNWVLVAAQRGQSLLLDI